MTNIDSTPRTADAAALTNGASFWGTHPVGELPGAFFSDGPNGVRAQDPDGAADHLGLRPSLPATCFPPGVALGQTWDLDLARRVGRALGREAAAAGVDVLNGPGVNIKRDPRGGRNFEYFSEDPHLTGALGSAVVEGLQSQGVGAAVKHFAANNTEHERFRASSDVDERTLREIYLRGFERIVREQQPWAVMCSYNRINGVPAASNRWLLTEVLRDEWGFDGLVVSDWGAVDDRAESIDAGLDLAMPGGDLRGDELLRERVRIGGIPQGSLDRAAGRVAALVERAGAARAHRADKWSVDEHHALAREAAERSLVLLKNDGGILPLEPDSSVAVIGELARTPRFQGGGSASVNATRVDVPLERIREIATATDVRFAAGYPLDGDAERIRTLRGEAVAAAADAEAAVLFLGVPTGMESEGFDREHLELDTAQLELLEAVAEVQPRIVVVLAHGGALILERVAPAATAILDAAVSGQGGGDAIARTLYGLANPSGRLTETVPRRVQDLPAYGSYPGENLHSRYAEGVFVGYRWYDHRDLDVAYPFGHGLAYTTFAYTELQAEVREDVVEVELTVHNTGERDGREIVQAYAGIDRSAVARAPRELRAFAAVDVPAGEHRTVRLQIPLADLAYWDVRAGRWVLEPGRYTIAVGASSRDLRGTTEVDLAGDPASYPLSTASTVAEVMADEIAGAELRQIVHGMFGAPRAEAGGPGIDMVRMIGTTPVGRFTAGLGPAMPVERLTELLDEANRRNGIDDVDPLERITAS